eukprot:UC4_evm5s1406
MLKTIEAMANFLPPAVGCSSKRSDKIARQHITRAVICRPAAAARLEQKSQRSSHMQLQLESSQLQAASRVSLSKVGIE